MRWAGSVQLSAVSHSQDTRWFPNHTARSSRNSCGCRRSFAPLCRTGDQTEDRCQQGGRGEGLHRPHRRIYENKGTLDGATRSVKLTSTSFHWGKAPCAVRTSWNTTACHVGSQTSTLRQVASLLKTRLLSSALCSLFTKCWKTDWHHGKSCTCTEV